MKCRWVLRSLVTLFALSGIVQVVQAQTALSNTAAAGPGCPVELMQFKPSGVHIHVKNVSGKNIVGMVFNAALSDATERWIWLHWNFDQTRPIREFGWNRVIKDGETKKLSWWADVEFHHGGGAALVLTSVLFEDGFSWEEGMDGSSCKGVWYNNHKKGFAKSIALPPRN